MTQQEPEQPPDEPTLGERPPLGPLVPVPGRWKRFQKACLNHRGRTVVAGLALALMVLLGFADRLLAAPMRRWAERSMNSELRGYTIRIGRLRPHLWRLAFDLDDVILMQDTHPEPPVANVGALQFSLQISELLRLKVAGELTVVRPALHIDLTQIREEVGSFAKREKRGWQRAVESVFPFKLDRVRVQDGSLLYLSGGTAAKPIQLTKVYLVAKNVRNIAQTRGAFPSPVTLEGLLFDTGRVWFQGSVDFLREPTIAAQGAIRLEQVPLDRLSPLAQAYQVKTTGGFLSLNGTVEYTPEAQLAHLVEVSFDDLRVDFVSSPRTRATERAHAKAAIKLAQRVRHAPTLRLEVDALSLKHSQLGFENQGTTPPYRVFISQLDLGLAHLSNQAGGEPSTFQARGAFMGSGTTLLRGRVRSSAKPADFEVNLEVEEARLPDLNGLLQAHAGVDVAEGLFSVFSEVTVKDGRVEGYVKPLIKNLKIYDRQKDAARPFRQRVKLHALQFLAGLFRNHTTHSVATVARISGSTGGPMTDEWAAIRKLIGNGLFRAIQPGFLEKANPAAPPRPSRRAGTGSSRLQVPAN